MLRNNFETIGVPSSEKFQLIDITRDISEVISSSGIDDGICYIYVPHTTAAVTINENADIDVQHDILLGLRNIIQDDPRFQHVEGNSQAHIMASMTGFSEHVIVDKGRLVLGRWQGIYFCEFDGPRSRKVHIKTIQG